MIWYVHFLDFNYKEKKVIIEGKNIEEVKKKYSEIFKNSTEIYSTTNVERYEDFKEIPFNKRE